MEELIENLPSEREINILNIDTEQKSIHADEMNLFDANSEFSVDMRDLKVEKLEETKVDT